MANLFWLPSNQWRKTANVVTPTGRRKVRLFNRLALATRSKKPHFPTEGAAKLSNRRKDRMMALSDEELRELLAEAADTLDLALEPWNGAAKANGMAFVKKLRAALQKGSGNG